MAEFDADFADMWADIKDVYGDRAVWRKQDGTLINLIGVPSASTELIGTSVQDNVLIFEFAKQDLHPQYGDTVEINDGINAGNYEFGRIIQDDGHTFIVSLRKL